MHPVLDEGDCFAGGFDQFTGARLALLESVGQVSDLAADVQIG
jgi:hypothetical protein